MLEKLENDDPVVSRNNESEFTLKKRPRFWVVLQLRFHMEKPKIFMEVFSPLRLLS